MFLNAVAAFNLNLLGNLILIISLYELERQNQISCQYSTNTL